MLDFNALTCYDKVVASYLCSFFMNITLHFKTSVTVDSLQNVIRICCVHKCGRFKQS